MSEIKEYSVYEQDGPYSYNFIGTVKADSLEEAEQKALAEYGSPIHVGLKNE